MAVDERLRAALPDVTVSIAMSVPVGFDVELGTRGAARWGADALLTVFPRDAGEEAFWGRPELASHRRVDGEALELTVATCSGLLLDLDQVGSAEELFDALDADSAFAHFLPLLDEEEAWLTTELDDELGGFGSRLLIVDRAQLSPGWRGGGVGRLLVGRALRWLLADVRLAALKPFPLQFASRGDDPGFAPALASVQQVWASLGFRAWHSDIWVMDPARGELEAALEGLERRLGLG